MRYLAVATLLVLMTVDHGRALSTGYGNTNKNKDDKPVHTSTTVRGRDCKVDPDCSSVANTYCITDHRDHKKRCLCLNRNAPSNAQCPKTLKALKSSCNVDHDCPDGAHCSSANNSSSSSSTTKICMCKDGYFEEEHLCNNGFQLAIPSLISLLVAYSFLVSVVSV